MKTGTCFHRQVQNELNLYSVSTLNTNHLQHPDIKLLTTQVNILLLTYFVYIQRTSIYYICTVFRHGPLFDVTLLSARNCV